jgi:hypothetical protein
LAAKIVGEPRGRLENVGIIWRPDLEGRADLDVRDDRRPTFSERLLGIGDD